MISSLGKLPPEITCLEPSCGPKDGDTEIHIHGNHFTKVKKAKVIFKYNRDTRTALGSVISTTEIVCKTPGFPFCCDATVEVLIDKILTRSGKRFHFYDELYITKVVPEVIAQECPSKLSVYVMCESWSISNDWTKIPNLIPNYSPDDTKCPHFTPLIRFIYGDGRHVEVEGVETRDSEHKILFTCEPPIERTGKIITAITLNGIDWSTRHRNCTDLLEIYAEPKYDRIVPACKPIHGTKHFEIIGSSIVQTKDIKIYFYRADKDQKLVCVTGDWIDDGHIVFTLGESVYEGESYVKISVDNMFANVKLPFYFYRFPKYKACTPEYGSSNGGTPVRLECFLEFDRDGETTHRKDIKDTYIKDTDDITVRLMHSGPSVKDNVIGVVKGELDVNGDLLFETPPNINSLAYYYSNVEDVDIEVAFDGKTYNGDLIFRYYQAPSILVVSENPVSCVGGTPFTVLLAEPVPNTKTYSIRFKVGDNYYIQKAHTVIENDPDAKQKLECLLPQIKNVPERGCECLIDVSFNDLDYSKCYAETYTIHVFLTPILVKIVPNFALNSGGDKIELQFDGMDTYLSEYEQYKNKSKHFNNSPITNNDNIKSFKLIKVKWSWQSRRYQDLYTVDTVVIENGKVYAFVPQCLADTPLVRVDVALGDSPFAPSPCILTYFELPELTSLSPSSGPVSGGSTLSIKGNGFVDTNYITVRFFNSTFNCTVSGTFVNENEILCVTPTANAVGFTTVEVSLNGQQFNLQKPLLFLFVQLPFSITLQPRYTMYNTAARISLLAKDIFYPGELYIKMTNDSNKLEYIMQAKYDPVIEWTKYFNMFEKAVNGQFSDAVVGVGLKRLTDVISKRMTSALNTNTAYFVTPDNIPPGKITFHLSSDGQQFKLADGYFDVIDNPVVKKITPSALHWSGGENVRIVGGNLQDLGCIKVRFTHPDTNETILVEGRSVKGGIECISPEFPKCGDWYYSVTLDGIKFITSSPIPIYGKIVIEEIYPNLGTIRGDTEVTVKGSGFADSGVAMARLTVIDNENNVYEPLIVSGKYIDNQIVFTSPRFPSSGKAKVEVSMNNRDWNCVYQNRNGDTDIIYFLVYPQPIITNIQISGNYRDIVHIEGSNFYSYGPVIVRFKPLDGEKKGEKLDIDGQIWNSSVIECKSPSLYTRCCVIEISLDGKHYTRQKIGIEFKVIPIITEISPSWGPLCGGTTLTLTGENFENTGKIVVSFSCEWGGDRRVLGLFTEDGTIQCQTPSFLDCQRMRRHKNLNVKVDVCLLGGRTLRTLPLLIPLKIFRYYDKDPLIWAVKPKDGPVYGNFAMFLETQQVHNTKDLLVRLRHEATGETFYIKPKYKKGGQLSLMAPAWEYSSDGVVSVNVTYNGQDYSNDHKRAKLGIWSTWQNRPGAAKNQSQQQTKSFDNPMDITGGTAEKYVSLKVIKENTETDYSLRPTSRVWKIKDSPFALPSPETVHNDLFLNDKKLQETVKKTEALAPKDDKNPIWLNKGAYFTEYDTPFTVEDPPVNEQVYHPPITEFTEMDGELLRQLDEMESEGDFYSVPQTAKSKSRASLVLSPYPMTRDHESLRESFHRSLLEAPNMALLNEQLQEQQQQKPSSPSKNNRPKSALLIRPSSTITSTANNTLRSTLRSESATSLLLPPTIPRAQTVPPTQTLLSSNTPFSRAMSPKTPSFGNTNNYNDNNNNNKGRSKSVMDNNIFNNSNRYSPSSSLRPQSELAMSSRFDSTTKSTFYETGNSVYKPTPFNNTNSPIRKRRETAGGSTTATPSRTIKKATSDFPYHSELSLYLRELFLNPADGHDTQICFMRVLQTFDKNWDNTLDYRSFCMGIRKLLPDISEERLSECWREAVPKEKTKIYYSEYINRLGRI